MESIDKDLENNHLEPSTESLTETLASEKETAEAAEENPNQPEPKSEISETQKWQTEAADWKDKYIRLYAEFENFRHRTSKEKISLISTATEGLMIELLPVMDDFERSIKAMEQASDVSSLKEGVELVFHKFSKTLMQKGLKPLEAVGKPFDADFHEAITQISAPSPDQKGLVLDEIEKGYMLNDKTIRYSKVVIGA